MMVVALNADCVAATTGLSQSAKRLMMTMNDVCHAQQTLCTGIYSRVNNVCAHSI